MISTDYYGDSFKWFVGVVKDADGDANRVRVRIFGIHHIDDTENVSDGDLPLALVILPTTGGQTGGGAHAHGLSSGTWVFGFFADGDDCQQPVIVGVIAGGYGSTDNTSTPNSGGAAGTITPGTSPSDTTGTSASATTPTTTAASTGTLNLTGSTNVEKAYNFLREKIEQSGKSSGNVHAQVSGILGNLLTESPGKNGDINVSANNPNDKGKRSFGIAQWRAERLTSLFRFAGNESPSLEQQLSFLWHELTTSPSEKKAFSLLMVATDVVQATDAFVWFERPECAITRRGYIDKSNHTYPPRLRNAQKVFNSIKYTPRTQ